MTKQTKMTITLTMKPLKNGRIKQTYYLKINGARFRTVGERLRENINSEYGRKDFESSVAAAHSDFLRFFNDNHS